MIRETTALRKIKELHLKTDKRKKVVQGGTSASKTFSILIVLESFAI